MSDPLNLRAPVPRHSYPDITEHNGSLPTIAQEVDQLRQLAQILLRENGNVLDSMISIRDLIDLGVIVPADLLKLKRGGTILDRAKELFRASQPQL